MPSFTYKIRDSQGRILTGTVEAESRYNVISKLKQPGYIVLDVSEKKEASAVMSISLTKSKVTRKELTIFSRQFSTMINSGLPLTQCLTILHKQTTNPRFKGVIEDLQNDIASGSTLSGALAKHDEIFPALYINTVKAGETGGVLDDVLNKLADHLEKEENIRAKVKGAMTYPSLAMGFTVIVVGFMITFVVPVFTKIFAELGGDLPLPTKILVRLSDFSRSYWYLILIFVVSAFFTWKRVKKIQSVRDWLDMLKLNIPVLGVLNRKTAVSTFTRTLGTLIVAGVPILAALEIVAETSGNSVISKAILKVKTAVKEGETIAKPLERTKVFTPMVTQMIAVGEETGALDVMLNKIADFYDSEVDVAVESLTSIIEPVMIVFMGLAVAGILVSLYLPMFKLVTLVK